MLDDARDLLAVHRWDVAAGEESVREGLRRTGEVPPLALLPPPTGRGPGWPTRARVDAPS